MAEFADHGDQMFTASREAYEANGRGFWVTSDEEQVKALGKSEAMYFAAARMQTCCAALLTTDW